MSQESATPPNGRLLPVLPLKNTVLFPGLSMPLAVGRPQSVAAATAAAGSEEKLLIVVAQRDPSLESPGSGDLYSTGTIGIIRKLNKADQGMSLVVTGGDRVKLHGIELKDGYLQSRSLVLPPPADSSIELDALRQSLIEDGQRLVDLAQPEAQMNVQQVYNENPDPLWLAFLFASMLGVDLEQQQAVLEASSRLDALKLVHDIVVHERQVLEVRQKIRQQAEGEITKEQRQYVLRQQLRAIQQELGEESPEKSDLEVLRKRLEEAALPDAVREQAQRELRQMERTPAAAPDYQLTRSHLELILDLPWKNETEEAIDLKKTRVVLDEDHYDVEDVKERILEHLAVMKLNPKAHAPILCFVGPPGVGKTSLGQSIARAIGRKFERMSLGGMHDEAELRGHRRTYIGAMPGRIVQALKRAGVNNPLLMLDEVDKLGRDYRGDPAAALLEVLDPAQNDSFRDNYLDLPFDLSRVFFICTANTLDTIPRPLLDRMELISLSGYTQEEKLAIARRYLFPRQLKAAGLTPRQLELSDEVLVAIAARYTREAGVRELERMIANIARKIARHFAEGKTDPAVVRTEDLAGLLGVERFLPERARKRLPAGVSTGLAWTEAGGDVLYIEAALMPGSSVLRLTGSLGDVMRESAKAAHTYIWSHAHALDIDRSQFKNNGVHVHVPAGAVPKDGPSAGVAMAVALASLYLHKPSYNDVAMTGEITLSGLVLPVGGIKEKVLAARRAGMKRVILPKDNAKDLRKLPQEVRDDMQFVLVETLEEALHAALPIEMPTTLAT